MALAVVAVAILTAGCDKVPLLAPTGSTITLTAPARILPTGGTTDVTATVLEASGSPVQNGTTVRFTTTLGRVDPVEVQTVNGVAITRFFAGDTSGVAEVRANSGNAGGGTSTGGTGGTTTATNVLQITVGAAATDSVLIRTNPASVSPNGGTVDVIASVLGAGGRALPSVPVTFSSSRGSLSSTIATTDGNGEARVQLTTNVETTVTASAGGKTSTAATVTVRLTPNITLTCAGTAAAAASCSQLAGAAVTFTVSRGATTSAFTSATLDFGDGSSASLGNLSSSVTVTHTYSSPATYTATATATDVNGERTSASVVVTINPRSPMNLTVRANPTSARVNTVVEFTATLGTGDTTPISGYRWEFINDTTGNTEATVTTSGNTTSRVFSTPGTRTVRVTATAVDGRTATAETQFVITTT